MSAQDVKEALKAFTPQFSTGLEGLLNKCNSVLEAAGLPRADERVWYEGDHWWRDHDPGLPKSSSLGRAVGHSLVAKTAAAHTDEWYAARIAGLILMIKKDKDGVFHSDRISELSSLITERDFLKEYGPAISTGMTQRKHLATRRQLQNEKVAIKARERQKIVASLLHKTNLTGLALILWIRKQPEMKNYAGVSERTIRRDLSIIRGQ